MGHLTIEALARLVGEAPTPDEKNHLETCPTCRSELESLREQTERIGSLPDLRPPPGDWEALEARLVSEGLIRSSGTFRGPATWWRSGWLQAAAALILFFGGTTLGSRVLARNGGEEAFLPASTDGLELIPVGTQAQPATDLAQAADAVNAAERQYMDALLRYRQILDSQGDPAYIGDPTARFAALEAIVAAGRAAVQKAPADPYLNGLLVSALAERQALVHNASLSPGNGVF